MNDNLPQLKVVLLGKPCGGKTCLMERFVCNRFRHEAKPTCGVAFELKDVKVDSRTVRIQIWDIGGSELYTSISRLYYRGAGAAIVCYDLTSPTSFDRIKLWVEQVKRSEEFCKIYLCGTKLDLVERGRLPRQVDSDVVADYTEELHAEVFETSSKTGYNVRDLFLKVAKDYLHDGKHIAYIDSRQEDGEDIALLGNNKRKRCGCCPW
ncbi:ras-related protein Rab-24-like [Acanthaster planci]|uniref:Ras-related protein Rab-24-like n=1 Tax=Acanthaster planci TaxID=133434 RepID=A0A8B7Y402_ACAPL|nr:ras-related protein Rab-24-like [Acanthaster planci]XP_022086598.1 ras-related protein Rab-24-like [Acanthaster planci]XP_022086599.1 ras-related protein Rab-24-like [Acanthaster planci]XP_022086600.1 ras-related protein Rab-24-like [Acanthaster planci]XP_022086601.1 ras-related protein Rab-24-like [Acanthaster planci]